MYLGALARDLVKNHGVRGELWGEIYGNAYHGDPGGPWSEVSVHHYFDSTWVALYWPGNYIVIGFT